MKSLRILALTAVMALVGAGSTTAATAKVKFEAENIKPIKQVKYLGGSELDAHGKYLYSGEIDGTTERGETPNKGGLHIFKLAKSGAPKEVGFLKCPGNDNDVAVVKRGLVAVGYHTNICGLPQGLMLVDVSNPKRPVRLGHIGLPGGGSSHTITPYPGTNLIYVNPGGLANGRSVEYIVDVKNPRKPEIVGSFTLHPAGCHDLSFLINKDKKLAFCAGMGSVVILDVSDPLSPTPVGSIVNPLIQFMHFAVPSSDGKLLAIDDEAFAAHDCNTGQSPTGSVWIYDISNPSAPLLQSRFAPPRGGDEDGIGTYDGWVPSWCLSHGLDWQPGTHNLAVTWFTGGVSVLDLSNPTAPSEVAWFQPEDAATYSALWHNGTLYTNDMFRGVDALKVSLKK